MKPNFETDLIKRFKLTNEQAEIYIWMKNQNINTDDGTLCYWAKTYPSKRIREVIDFANSRRNAGQEIKNLGAWIKHFLKNGLSVIDENCKENLAFSKEFLERTKWKDLRIYEKYVKDNVTDDDLSLNMPIDDFKRSLEALYRKSQLYK